MRFAVAGCGEAGGRRAAAIASVDGASIAVCVDAIEDRAASLAAKYGADASTDWLASISRSDVDAVVIATANHLHASMAIAAADAGKHILCERPLARNPSEGEQIVNAARHHEVRLKMGLSHRYHPTVRKARELVLGGRIGNIVFIRGWTGRGGYVVTPPSEWMVDCELSGGGTLLDNGTDLIDLCRYFMGDFRQVIGHTAALVWPIEPCEDNAFAVMWTADGRAAHIHSSWTDWRTYLYLEISGTDGYVRLNYDDGIVATGSRPGVPGLALEDVFDLSGEPDRSLELEVGELMNAVSQDRERFGSGDDGLEALVLAHAIYLSAEERRAVKV